jgi:hypothetical protein
VLEVGADGRRAEAEPLGDLRGQLAGGDQPEDLALAR